jgi:hypothetical protein
MISECNSDYTRVAMPVILDNMKRWAVDNNIQPDSDIFYIAAKVFSGSVLNDIFGVDVFDYQKDITTGKSEMFTYEVGGGKIALNVKEVDVDITHRKILEFQAAYNPDGELSDALVSEMLCAIDLDAINSVVDLVKTDDQPIKLDFLESDCFNLVAETIVRETNLIAARSRRGAANVLVVDPMGLTALQAYSGDLFTFKRNSNGGESFIDKAGCLVLESEHEIEVYRNPYGFTSGSGILLGYKGKNEKDSSVKVVWEIPATIENDGGRFKVGSIGGLYVEKDGSMLSVANSFTFINLA